MQTEKRLCPFRKRIKATDWKMQGASTYTEEFLECIGEKCMAYYVAWKGFSKAMEHPACRCMEGDC